MHTRLLRHCWLYYVLLGAVAVADASRCGSYLTETLRFFRQSDNLIGDVVEFLGTGTLR